MNNWPVRIDEMLAAMARASHLASDSNADLSPNYRRELDLIKTIRSEIITALETIDSELDRVRGPLIELVIAYQDADSPEIQDTLKRARAALSSQVGTEESR